MYYNHILLAMENKRNSRRITFKERVKYGLPDKPNTDGSTINISPKGLAIKSYKALPPGSRISVIIYSGNAPIRLEGEIVWNSPPDESTQAQMGVKVLSRTKELEHAYKQAAEL